MRAAVVAGVVAALLAGCSSGSDSGAAGTSSSAAPSSSSAPTPSRSVDANGFPIPTLPACAEGTGADFVVVTTSEGNAGGVVLMGRGTTGVVLAPESGGSACQWVAYATELGDRYRIALFDWDEPREEMLQLAVTTLAQTGVRRIVLGGASLGGAFALADAHRIRPRPAGVLSFSGELTVDGFDGRPGIRHWRGPLLALGSVEDDYFDTGDARQLRRLHPGPETVVMVRGGTHGVDLLDDPAQARIRSAVDRFLARVLG